MLRYTDESGLGRILRAVLGRRLDRAAPQAGFTAHAASVLRTMALDGRGLAWLPATLVADDIALGRLVPAGGVDWTVPLEIRLYRERAPLGEVAEAFWKSAAGRPPA
jgi:DNA-binding transcriptional LysR family regulator